MKLIIAGIDPGTTAGLAAIDLDGNLLLLKSIKNAARAEISEAILDAGMPLIIAGDVNPPPKMLEKLAAGFSANVFFPEKNMTRLEKIRIAERYSKSVSPDRKLWGNKHERDALAAALRAWKRIRPLIMKVEGATADMNREKANNIMTCVLMGKRSIEECKRGFG